MPKMQINPDLYVGDISETLYSVFSNKIIDSYGNNSNGYYIRFKDGTMICWVQKSINIDCTSLWVTFYEGGASAGNFPATFASTPYVFASNTAPDGYLEGVRGSSRTSWGEVRMALPNSNNRTFAVNLFAIGKWK